MFYMQFKKTIIYITISLILLLCSCQCKRTSIRDFKNNQLQKEYTKFSNLIYTEKFTWNDLVFFTKKHPTARTVYVLFEYVRKKERYYLECKKKGLENESTEHFITTVTFVRRITEIYFDMPINKYYYERFTEKDAAQNPVVKLMNDYERKKEIRWKKKVEKWLSKNIKYPDKKIKQVYNAVE